MAAFPWLTHVPRALERIATVPKAAWAGPGQRPVYSDHLGTIRYAAPPDLLREAGVIMLDDVYTQGQLSAACRDILKRDAGVRFVVGLFIGRTVRP
jgi:hypothetical protein